MELNFKNYTDEDGLVHDNTGTKNIIENSTLYTSYTAMLYSLYETNEYKRECMDRSWCVSILNCFNPATNTWSATPNPDVLKKEGFSRDNIVGTSSLIKRVDWKLFRSIWNMTKFNWQWANPQDFIWVNYCARKWWSYPLLPILWTSMYVSITSLAKCGNGNLDTDGKLMTWLRLMSAQDTWWSKKLIKYFENKLSLNLEKYLKENCKEIPEWTNYSPYPAASAAAKPWRTLFSMYFQDMEHPINKMCSVIWP